MISDETFQRQILALVAKDGSIAKFQHPEVSVLAACYRRGIPFTVHAGIGTDVIDQHPSFDGQAKGGCSGRDFLIYTNEVTKLTTGRRRPEYRQRRHRAGGAAQGRLHGRQCGLLCRTASSPPTSTCASTSRGR